MNSFFFCLDSVGKLGGTVNSSCSSNAVCEGAMAG
jgi:hypothetical protein